VNPPPNERRVQLVGDRANVIHIAVDDIGDDEEDDIQQHVGESPKFKRSRELYSEKLEDFPSKPLKHEKLDELSLFDEVRLDPYFCFSF